MTFKDSISAICSSGFEPEGTDHYLLRCKLYTDLRLDLLNDVYIYIYIKRTQGLNSLTNCI